MTTDKTQIRWAALCGAICFVALLGSGLAADVPAPHPSLDQGFRLLYNLDFDQGHQVFLSWQRDHPQDPVGPTAEAAGILFSEFHRLGVLEGQFYENDKKFLNREQKEPDAGVRDRFNGALTRAQDLASARLAANAKDRDALFAMTLSSGLQADYAAMIEKKNMSSLHYTREANDWADQLLAVDPKCYDARVATGFSKYIIGSMVLLRAFYWLSLTCATRIMSGPASCWRVCVTSFPRILCSRTKLRGWMRGIRFCCGPVA